MFPWQGAGLRIVWTGALRQRLIDAVGSKTGIGLGQGLRAKREEDSGLVRL